MDIASHQFKVVILQRFVFGGFLQNRNAVLRKDALCLGAVRHAKLTAFKLGQTENDFENRNLARTVFSNQSVNLSLPDGQIDILQNLMRPVALLNAAQRNHIHYLMLLCLDYAANYNENARLPPPTTAYTLLYIPVYIAIYGF